MSKNKRKKPSRNWFNEYQEVEDYLIKELGDEYVKIDFSKIEKKSASEATILMIKKLVENAESRRSLS